MVINNLKLISVSDSDIIDGVFYNDAITEIGDDCFVELSSLIKISAPYVLFVGDRSITGCENLTDIDLPELRGLKYASIFNNHNLIQLNLPKLSYLGKMSISSNFNLTSLKLDNLVYASCLGLSTNFNLTSLELPELVIAEDNCIVFNTKLVSLELPVIFNTGLNCFHSNSSLKSVLLGKNRLSPLFFEREFDKLYILTDTACVGESELYHGYELIRVVDGELIKNNYYTMRESDYNNNKILIDNLLSSSKLVNELFNFDSNAEKIILV